MNIDQDTDNEDIEALGEDVESKEPKEPTVEEDVEKKPSRKPWYLARINELTAQKKSAEAQNKRLEEALTSLSNGELVDGDDEDKPRRIPQSEIDRLAQEKAEAIAAQKEFNAECNKTFDAGVAEYSDFSTAINNFSNLGEMRLDIVDIINQLEGSHRVLYHLANNLDELESIYSMRLPKASAELAKLADKLNKKPAKPISKVPPPINPVDGKKIIEGLSDDLPMGEWLSRRNKELSERRAR